VATFQTLHNWDTRASRGKEMQKFVANVNLKNKQKMPFFLSDLIPFNVLMGG
jgi:hypothetical protein